MRFTNRSLTRRGSKRRIRAIKARRLWSRDMTLLVATIVGVLALILFSALR